MLTPFQINQLSQPTIGIYSQLENDILTAIAKRLKTDKDITKDNALKWQFDKLAQMNDLNKDVIKLIANMSGKNETEIDSLVENSMQQSVDPMDQWLQKVADTGRIEKAVPLKQDTAVFNTLRMFQKQAKDNLNMINSTILHNSGQVYRDILSQATASVLSGFKTHQQALADASAKWAEKGVAALIDSAGRQWSIEGYVPLVTRTVSNNVANQTQWNRMDSYGLDLIEVTTVAAPRPGCAPYQGHIYSKNGRDKRYPPLSGTTYGEPAGLFGCNCHHTSFPYIPGVTIKRYDPIPLGEAHAAYEQSQKQRYLERQIRKAKTQAEMMKALGDDDAIKRANMKIRQRQQNMRDFIKETNRTRRYDREQTVSTPTKNQVDKYRVPNYDSPTLPDAKFSKYILNKDHPKGGPKAEAFDKVLGYNLSNKNDLMDSIREHLPKTKAKFKGNNGHGDLYEAIMDLKGPNGKTAPVLTAWINQDNETRLTSAYVIGKNKADRKRGGAI